jgi:hypothetical protein
MSILGMGFVLAGIDQHAVWGRCKRRGDARGLHPRPRFGHRLTRQADDEERGQAGRDLHVNLDRHRLDVGEGEAAG